MATYKTVTVGPGKTYATLAAALSGEQADLTTGTDRPGDLVIQCYAMSDTTAINTSSYTYTTSASARIIIEAAENHGGAWNTGAYRLSPAASIALKIDGTNGVNHVLLKGIQISAATPSSDGYLINVLSQPAGSTFDMEKCICFQTYAGAGTTANQILRLQDSDTVYKFRNCVFYGTSGSNNVLHGLVVTGSTAAVYFDNCTVDGLDGTALNLTSTAVRLRNTRVTSCTTVKGGTGDLHSASNYNLTDGTAPTNWGANSIDSTDTPTIDYVDDSNATLTSRDYHLGATDSGIGAGVDLSSDGDNPFSDDIDGETRG